MFHKEPKRWVQRGVAMGCGLILAEVTPCLMWILLEAELVTICIAALIGLFWGFSLHEIGQFRGKLCMMSYSHHSFHFFGSLVAASGYKHCRSLLHHLRNMKRASLGKVIKNPSQVPFHNLAFSKECKAGVCAQTFYLLHVLLLWVYSFMHVCHEYWPLSPPPTSSPQISLLCSCLFVWFCNLIRLIRAICVAMGVEPVGACWVQLWAHKWKQWCPSPRIYQ